MVSRKITLGALGRVDLLNGEERLLGHPVDLSPMLQGGQTVIAVLAKIGLGTAVTTKMGGELLDKISPCPLFKFGHGFLLDLNPTLSGDFANLSRRTSTKYNMADFEPTKRPHKKSEYTQEQLLELIQCESDPFYFIKNFVKVQHATKGIVPLELFPFQYDIIRGFHEHRNSITLTSRQMGKTLVYDTKVSRDGEIIKLGTLVKLTFRQKIVNVLEKTLIKITRSIPV